MAVETYKKRLSSDDIAVFSRMESMESDDMEQSNDFSLEGRERKRSRSSEASLTQIRESVQLSLNTHDTTIETSFEVEELLADFYDEASMLYNLMSDMNFRSSGACAVESILDTIAVQIEQNNICPIDPALVLQQLFQVYMYLYGSHYEHFNTLGAAEHLNTCCHRLLSYTMEKTIVEKSFLAQFQQFVMQTMVQFQ